MDLLHKNICFVCAYAAEYGGNFLRMLSALAERLRTVYDCKVHFIFPTQPDKDWLRELKEKNYRVGFTTSPYGQCSDDILHFIEEWHLDLIHTHFEVYDVDVAHAVKKSARPVQMVWHLHDYQSLDKTGLSLPWLRKFFTNQRFWQQYGKWGKDAYFIGVSSEMTAFVTHYRKHRFSYPPPLPVEQLSSMDFPKAEVVLNGIDMNRVHYLEHKKEEPVFTFLSFGGESKSKGIATLFAAAEKLDAEHLPFIVKITRGYTTDALLREYYHDSLPAWLQIIPQTEHVRDLYAQADCYISASLRETMSMAIAEAAICGLPVIQSDIYGTWWNSKSPSTFLFQVENADALALRMKEVMGADKLDLQEKCKATSEHLTNLLSMDAWVNNIINSYQIL